MAKIQVSARFRTTKIIILSILSGAMLLIFFGYLMSLSGQIPPSPFPEHTMIGRAIYGAALVLGIAVVIGRRALFNSNRLLRLFEAGGLDRLVEELASKTLLLAAISEVIVLLGFVLSVLSGSSEPMWRLGAVGVLLILFNMPRQAAWERTFETINHLASADIGRNQ